MKCLRQFASGLRAGVHQYESVRKASASENRGSGLHYLWGAWGALLIMVAVIPAFISVRSGGIDLHAALVFGACFLFGLSLLSRSRVAHAVWLRVSAWALFLASLVVELVGTTNSRWGLIFATVFVGLALAHEIYEAARKSA
jgi:hypothetical protein